MALGGTGYAATQLSKASVGAKHLKKNAVSSAKVKDSSLLLGDFKLSERSKLRGERGGARRGGCPWIAGAAWRPGSPGNGGRHGD